MSAKMYLFWHKAMLDARGSSSDEYRTQRQLTSPKSVLPQLTWFSPEANEMIMQRCTKSIWTSYRYMLDIRSGLEDLLTEISQFDFRYIVMNNYFPSFLVWLSRIDPSPDLMRLEADCDLDRLLLEKACLASALPMRPATFPF
ncbi:hypothetical protein AGABI2DRAFT_193955, partial [Agaricus bisporus var. bisporus H97]|uniref:hypothetical protein n=1 Tax=Agaricus bisporus var. bisporus (strain H97 / ATCC MYA-4626 / FGSC 10389) TaxID=936046 RepID=UPI00029F67FB